MDPWYKDPKILGIAGVAIFAAFILLRSKSSAPAPADQATTGTSGAIIPPDVSNPLGVYSTYLSGTGDQHQAVTQPYIIDPGNMGNEPFGSTTNNPNPNKTPITSFPIQLEPFYPYYVSGPQPIQLPTINR